MFLTQKQFPLLTVLTPLVALFVSSAYAVDWREARKIALVHCKAGSFTMGSPETEPGRDDKYPLNEDQRKVTIERGFWIGKTEVTQSQWKAVMGTEPWKKMRSVPTGVAHPACDVSWVDAMDFCRLLTVQERRAGRLEPDWEFNLPTEAQWEYACRAGTTTAYWFGDDVSLLERHEWPWIDKYGKYAHRVATKSQNPWGLFDMHGNLSEWCRDQYEEKDDDPLDPVARPRVKLRIIRGGNWASTEYFGDARSARRSNGTPTYRGDYRVGFRVVKVLVK